MRRLVVALVSLSALVSPSFASSTSGSTDPANRQPPAVGSRPPEAGGVLAGAVRTTEGTAVPQVRLVIAGPDGTQAVLSGPDGRYRVAGLRPGTYRVEVEAPGLRLTPEATAEVGAGEARLDLILAPAPVREHVVVAATRSEAPLSNLGVSATALDRDEIDSRRTPALLSLLQELPGMATARTGGVGLQSSLFLRGGDSTAVRFLVDGVPVNEPGGFYDFGRELAFEVERIEVVRGAASSLYGSDALAGVVQLVTRHAQPGESPGVSAEAEAGGFAWRRGALGTSGRSGGLDWNAGLLRLETDNQEPNSAFRETAGAASLGTEWGARSSLRLTFRGNTNEAGTPGQTAFGRPDLDASIERSTYVAGGRWQLSGDRASHEIHAGYSRLHELSLDPLDSGSFVPRAGDQAAPFEFSDFTNDKGFQNDTRRLSFGYQAQLRPAGAHLVTAGAELERETGDLGDLRALPLLSPSRTNAGLYGQDRIVIGRAFVTVGARLEHNDSFGTRLVPRAALAWRVRGGRDTTTLRASAGAGIKEPTFYQSFGSSSFARGNPDLAPERSHTFDVGFEQRLGQDRLRFEATLYRHDYLDQIAFHLVDPATFEGTFVNIGKARAQGVELMVEASPVPSLHVTAQYTRLDGEILVSTSDFDAVYAVGKGLVRRPKHQGSLSVRGTVGRASAGLTVIAVGSRKDSDFLGIGLTDNGGYARVDARAALRLGHGLEASVVADNLLDRKYQEALGYPALGRSVRAGLSLHSGGR